MKRVKCSVAAVVKHSPDGADFLAVRRPPDDEHLPDVWGLPAVSLMPGELPEAGLRRIGVEKLGTALEAIRFIGIKSMDRGDYELILMDLEARVVGPEPAVAGGTSLATRYVEQRWTADLTLLCAAARKGSLCCQLLLEAHALPY